ACIASLTEDVTAAAVRRPLPSCRVWCLGRWNNSSVSPGGGKLMGAGWHVALEKDVAGIGGALPHAGKALLFAQHHLEEIARSRELPPLKEFFSSDPTAVAAYLRAQGIEADEEELAAEEWFDPADALPTVRALLESLHDPPAGLGQVEKVR